MFVVAPGASVIVPLLIVPPDQPLGTAILTSPSVMPAAPAVYVNVSVWAELALTRFGVTTIEPAPSAFSTVTVGCAASAVSVPPLSDRWAVVQAALPGVPGAVAVPPAP
jgi:hypothetical protein